MRESFLVDNFLVDIDEFIEIKRIHREIDSLAFCHHVTPNVRDLMLEALKRDVALALETK